MPVASAERAALIASSGSSLPTQAPLAADAAADLCHRFSTCAEKACQAGAVVAAAFDRPHPGAWRVSISEPQRLQYSHAPQRQSLSERQRLPCEHRQLRGHADRDGCRHRSRSPARLQASRLILRLVGSGTPVWSRETARQVCDESRRQGGQAPDQAQQRGARPASPCTPGRSIPKARKRGLTPEESRTTRRPPSLATAP